MFHHVTFFISIILFSNLLIAQDLTDLDDIYVTIAVVEGLQEDVNNYRIKTDVELKLRMAGITVVDDSKDAEAELYFSINGFKTNDDRVFIIDIDITVIEFVYLMWRLKDKEQQAHTYVSGNVYKITANHFDRIRSKVKDLTDTFINEYLADNPK